MASELKTTSCCGVLELAEVSLSPTPEICIATILPTLKDNTLHWQREKPFIMFTSSEGGHMGQASGSYAKNLADYIEQNNLGTVEREILSGENWTKNTIRLWFWRPNYEQIKAQYDGIITRANAARERRLIEREARLAGR